MKISKSILLFAIVLGGSIVTMNAKQITDNSTDEMLQTLVKYTSINSQSKYPPAGTSIFTMTEGQHQMALTISNNVREVISQTRAKGVEVIMSKDNYVYVNIPANIKGNVPSLGISCHLDVTPEIDLEGRDIVPIIDTLKGHTIVRTDSTTLLGADDKCGCTIAMQLIRTVLRDKKLRHGRLLFAFCPNEDVGMAADRVDPSIFSPDILFDIDGEESMTVTRSNFTAQSYNMQFIGRPVHPADAKRLGLGDPVAAAATFIASVPLEYRPENSEGTQGYIQPFDITKHGDTVNVMTRVRYFDREEGKRFINLLESTVDRVRRDFPNVKTELISDALQYENIKYSMYPDSEKLITDAAQELGYNIKFEDARGGTTASMFASKGMRGGMCVFAGMHYPHSVGEYADLNEMEASYRLLFNIIGKVSKLKLDK